MFTAWIAFCFVKLSLMNDLLLVLYEIFVEETYFMKMKFRTDENHTENLFQNLYIFSLTLLFLKGYNFFYFWNLHVIIFLGLNLMSLFLLLFTSGKMILNIRNLLVMGFLILIYFFISLGGYNVKGIVVNMLYGIVFFFFVMTPFDLKKKALKQISVVYAAILSVTLFFYFLIIILKIPFPYNHIVFNDGQYEFNNYRILLERVNGDYSAFFVRFNSLFLEPGHIGVVSAILLAANNFDMKKKENKIILFCALCTLSLATYILLIFALAYKNMTRKRIKYLFVLLLILCVVFAYFTNKAEGFFYERIISRLVFEDGNIAGNNRVSSKFDSFYNKFFESSRKFLGYGAQYGELNLGPAAGYKAYLVQFGIVGTVLVLVLYVILCSSLNRNTLLLFLIWFLAFIQAAYPLTPTQFIVFCCGVEVTKNTKSMTYRGCR